MIRTHLAILLLICTLQPVSGLDHMGLNNILSEDEAEKRYLDRRREKAATYRIERARAIRGLTKEYHQEGTQLALAIETLLEKGDWRTARSRIFRAQKTHPFCHAASRFQHALLRTYLAVGDLRESKLNLVDLAERFTDYPYIQTANREALLVAKKVADVGSLINLDATKPKEVLNENAIGALQPGHKLFKYLANPNNSDRQEIAPEAALYFARYLLAKGYKSKDRILQARLAYRYLLDEFPEAPQVFEALCELAVSHLLVYKGDQFDVGALINAAGIIRRARLYVGDNAKREALINRYENLILLWHQDRDLQVARYYRKRDQTEAARYYYTQARLHDPGSDDGIAATRELEELPKRESAGLKKAGTIDDLLKPGPPTPKEDLPKDPPIEAVPEP